VYSVPIDIAPGASVEDIDLVGELSTDWNQRTLALMARAGLIRLLGAELLDTEQTGGSSKFERLELLEDRHSDLVVWEAKIEPVRERIMRHSAESFDLLQRFVQNRECPARLLAHLYERPDTEVAVHCSSCARCRQEPGERAPDGVIPQRLSPWQIEAPLADLLRHMIGPTRNLLVSYPRLEPAERTKREVEEMIQRLDQLGIRICIRVGDVPAWLAARADAAISGRAWVTTATDHWSPFGWPKGPRLVLSSEAAAPGARTIRVGEATPPTILFVPSGTRDPMQPERDLGSVFPGPTTTLEHFVADILQ